MFFYTAYAQIIQSEYELPGFRRTNEGKADIEIHREVVDRSIIEKTDKVKAKKTPGGVEFTCPFGVQYEISNGNKIILRSRHRNRLHLEILPLYGFSLAAVLQQKGQFVIHASSIDIAGRKVALVGEKMAGKSSLAMNLLSQGNKLVSDDVTSIYLESSSIKILPGVASIKLWPDAMKAVGVDPSCYPELYPGSKKRNYLVDGEWFCDKAGELDAIFFLEEAAQLEVKELTGVEKITWLMKGHYLSRYENALSSNDRQNAFQKCSDISRKIRLIKLSRPSGFHYMSDTVNLIKKIVCHN